mmetsp:Transcript_4253/g.10763  ORF Transcript_4253/g.10763 Transcript_4253/m.10763 type:complete len:214 (+) Transcript_4253:525-1166(+)
MPRRCVLVRSRSSVRPRHLPRLPRRRSCRACKSPPQFLQNLPCRSHLSRRRNRAMRLGRVLALATPKSNARQRCTLIRPRPAPAHPGCTRGSKNGIVYPWTLCQATCSVDASILTTGAPKCRSSRRTRRRGVGDPRSRRKPRFGPPQGGHGHPQSQRPARLNLCQAPGRTADAAPQCHGSQAGVGQAQGQAAEWSVDSSPWREAKTRLPAGPA